ncbi:DUF4303 domain-containing protein [Actinomycetota bacterium]
MTVRVVEFDADAVRDALRDAVHQAWTLITSVSPAEQIYGLMLYEGAEYGYVCVTPFTEEGLDRVTAKYRSGRFASSYQGDAGRESLRWSAPDSPYHVLAEVSSPPLVSSETQYRLWQEWHEDHVPLARYRDQIRGSCIEVLQGLDHEGLFCPSRKAITLMVLNRDGRESAEEARAMVATLNPPAVLARYDRTQSGLNSN